MPISASARASCPAVSLALPPPALEWRPTRITCAASETRRNCDEAQVRRIERPERPAFPGFIAIAVEDWRLCSTQLPRVRIILKRARRPPAQRKTPCLHSMARGYSPMTRRAQMFQHLRPKGPCRETDVRELCRQAGRDKPSTSLAGPALIERPGGGQPLAPPASRSPDLKLVGELAIDLSGAFLDRFPRRRGNLASARFCLPAFARARPLPRLGRRAERRSLQGGEPLTPARQIGRPARRGAWRRRVRRQTPWTHAGGALRRAGRQRRARGARQRRETPRR